MNEKACLSFIREQTGSKFVRRVESVQQLWSGECCDVVSIVLPAVLMNRARIRRNRPILS